MSIFASVKVRWFVYKPPYVGFAVATCRANLFLTELQCVEYSAFDAPRKNSPQGIRASFVGRGLQVGIIMMNMPVHVVPDLVAKAIARTFAFDFIAALVLV